jgi:hypothetical protein
MSENSGENAHHSSQESAIHEGGEPVHFEQSGVSEQALTSTSARVPPPAFSADPEARNGGGVGTAVAKFEFQNPFQKTSKLTPVEKVQILPPKANSSNLPSGVPGVPQTGGDVSASRLPENSKFSELSAAALAKKIGDKISTFKTELWVSEDVSGSAFLEVVTPSSLSVFLEHSMLITSPFTRSRVENFVKQLICADNSLSVEQLQLWGSSSANASIILQTPAHLVAPTKLFSSHPAARDMVRPQVVAPSFLSEIQGRAGFSLDDSTAFHSPSFNHPFQYQGQAVGYESPQTQQTQFSIGSQGMFIPGEAVPRGSAPFQVVFQPASEEKPQHIYLEHYDNEEQFYSWLRKNRKENALASSANKKSLTSLMSTDCKEELIRIIVRSQSSDPELFDIETPYPSRGWSDVSEKLCLKILFKVNGPKSASDAVSRLRKKRFFFNDSTIDQKFFTAKLRKHIKEFTTQLLDFAFCSRHWPKHDDDLSHTMIVEAFLNNFSLEETVDGPDGKTKVPKCSNLVTVRDKIRQNKTKPLEDILTIVIEHFERLDAIVRGNPGGAAYPIVPWKKADVKGQKRLGSFNRQVNEIRNGGISKPPRPPAKFPRCNNCGSKGHACGEETCYLFGHPKGKGLNGSWPEGTESLKLSATEYKEWRVKRHPIFMSYACNKRPVFGVDNKDSTQT